MPDDDCRCAHCTCAIVSCHQRRANYRNLRMTDKMGLPLKGMSFLLQLCPEHTEVADLNKRDD